MQTEVHSAPLHSSASVRKAYIQMHVAIFLYGFTAILGRLISLPEWQLVWWRLVITVLVYAVLFRFRLPTLPRRDLRTTIGIGVLLMVHWLCFFGAVKYANVSVALVCCATATFFIAFLEPMMLGGRPKAIEVALGVLSALGIWLIFTFNTAYTVGIILGLLAALTSAICSVVNKTLVGKGHDVQLLNFYQMLAGFVVLTVAGGVALPLGWVTVQLPTWVDMGWLVVLAALCTNYAYGLALASLRVVSAYTYMLAVNLEPLYGIVLAWLIFGENSDLNIRFIVGTVLVLVSVALYPLLSYGKAKILSGK